ncbi:hypothetical protein EAY39_18765, partial [Vibrio anguillarum]
RRASVGIGRNPTLSDMNKGTPYRYKKAADALRLSTHFLSTRERIAEKIELRLYLLRVWYNVILNPTHKHFLVMGIRLSKA